MQKQALFVFSLLGLLVGSSVYAANSDPKATAVLMKARKYIGEESALNGVKTLRFKGNLTTAKGETNTIEINLRAPYQQLQVLKGTELAQEVGLNDYEAWKKIYRLDAPDIYNLIPSNTDQLKRVRANTYENLNFFSPQSDLKRKLEFLGQETIDGELVDRVKVIYGAIYYVRNFKASTGQLLLTEIETGERIKESGEIIVNGIRFPKTLISFLDGAEVHRIEFDSIEVNPKLDDSLFKQPDLPGLKKK